MKRAALALLTMSFAVTFLPGPWGDESVTDLPLYASYAALFGDGALPYRDVAFEYPPLAAPVLALAGVAGTDYDGYRVAFAALAFLLAAALVLLTGTVARRTGGDARRAMLAAAVAPLLTGAMVRTHFDLAPVVLTLAALALLCAARPRAGMGVLGLAVMTKGFSLVVAPVALGWLVARGERRAALEGALALGLVVLAVAGAAAALSPSGAYDAVAYHLERPVQLESAPAAVLFGLDAVGAGEAVVAHSHRSEGVQHPASGPVSGIFAALLAGTVALLAGAAGRAGGRAPPGEGERAFVLASLGAVAAFAAFGKVLSPQFLIWVVPLGALAVAWRMRGLALAVAVAVALTLVEFPAHYGDVVAREPAALWLVALRDAVLIAVVLLAGREVLLSREPVPGSARSPWPFRRRRPRPAPR